MIAVELLLICSLQFLIEKLYLILNPLLHFLIIKCIISYYFLSNTVRRIFNKTINDQGLNSKNENSHHPNNSSLATLHNQKTINNLENLFFQKMTVEEVFRLPTQYDNFDSFLNKNPYISSIYASSHIFKVISNSKHEAQLYCYPETYTEFIKLNKKITKLEKWIRHNETDVPKPSIEKPNDTGKIIKKIIKNKLNIAVKAIITLLFKVILNLICFKASQYLIYCLIKDSISSTFSINDFYIGYLISKIGMDRVLIEARTETN